MTAGGAAPQTRPLVGITTYPVDEGGRVSLPAEYIDAVRRAGAEVVLVAPGDDTPGAVLARLDALVLAGGGDIDPSVYAPTRHETVYGTDSDRDHSDLALVRRAVDDGIPTLAICRGLQVLNVALGGTLHQHLPEVVGEQVAHRAPPREPVPHAVDVEPDSLVGELMGVARVEPMSWHHQAVDRLGAGLRVVARAPDGVVEAVALDEHPWLAAVQWHPEITAAVDESQQRLFDGLVARARTGRRP